MMKIAKKIIFSLMVLGLLAPLKIFALEIDWPKSPAGTSLTDQSTMTELTKYAYEWTITLGILAFFVSIVINGVKYMTSTGDPGKTANVRKRIQSSAAGLGLLLFSWIILNFLNPRLTTLFIPDPTKALDDQITSYEYLNKNVDSCDLMLLYPYPNYQGTPAKFTDTQVDPLNLTISTPHSLRVLKQIKPDEQAELQKKIDEENVQIKKKNARITASGSQNPLQAEKTLEDAIKEKYNSDSFSYEKGTYVNYSSGCILYFYRVDNVLWGAFGSTDVVVFPLYGSTPDFNSLYSNDELEKIEKVRSVIQNTNSSGGSGGGW